MSVRGSMTVKRLLLVIATVVAILAIGYQLLTSWSQPQFQSRLELYQTNLVLQATELRTTDPNLLNASKSLLGGEPVKLAADEYQEFRQSVQKSLERQTAIANASPVETSEGAFAESPTAAVEKLSRLRAEVDLRLGVLQAAQGTVDRAQQTWQSAIQQAANQPNLDNLSKTAAVLQGLWSETPNLLPDAEPRIQRYLDGWFRNRALTRLYELQQRQPVLQALQMEEQQAAEKALSSLAIVAGVPILGCVLGIGVLLFLVGQWLFRRKQSLLAPGGLPTWQVPWGGEEILQVFVIGFFLIGQLVAPLVLQIAAAALRFNPATAGGRGVALYYLANYLLIAAGGLTVLALSLKPFRPLPEGWFPFRFRSRWLLWGVGGYLAALPLVILVALVNEKLWQGQGGSNPILPIVLEGRDPVALAIFFAMAAVAAPIFEEILFRGFLLPSLTRYLPTWGAIGLSALLFAVAHLSLSEVLPLMVLGIILGFVYARSRNLLSSILLHSLWNSGTLLSLFILGGGSSQ